LRDLLNLDWIGLWKLDLLLPGSQYGFRKGRSCNDCIALLLLEIYKGFLNRNPVGVLFLDIKGAYDNVIPNILVDIINDMRIPMQYKKILGNLMMYRNVKLGMINMSRADLLGLGVSLRIYHKVRR